jgi:hypothetical protein
MRRTPRLAQPSTERAPQSAIPILQADGPFGRRFTDNIECSLKIFYRLQNSRPPIELQVVNDRSSRQSRNQIPLICSRTVPRTCTP